MPASDGVFLVLDLFCGGGGAAMGLHAALTRLGIKHAIVGVDNRDMSAIYPFSFVRADVFDLAEDWDFFSSFDLYWSSPPCQLYSSANRMNRKIGRDSQFVNLVPKTRALLLKTNKPFVIENVASAPVRRNLVLCGTMFKLGVFRHRVFETSFFVPPLPHKAHDGAVGDGKYFTIMRGPGWDYKDKQEYDFEKWKNAMGIKHIPVPTTKYLPRGHPLSEAIPPAYADYIATHLFKKHKTIADYSA